MATVISNSSCKNNLPSPDSRGCLGVSSHNGASEATRGRGMFITCSVASVRTGLVPSLGALYIDGAVHRQCHTSGAVLPGAVCAGAPAGTDAAAAAGNVATAVNAVLVKARPRSRSGPRWIHRRWVMVKGIGRDCDGDGPRRWWEPAAGVSVPPESPAPHPFTPP